MSALLDSHGAPLRAPSSRTAVAIAAAPATILVFPQSRSSSRASRAQGGRSTGLAIVVGIHLLAGWALASGLAQHVADAVRKPIEMAIISETPPPPPPPPKIEKLVERPKAAVPPPAYVPPPEVTPPPAPAAPTITATTAVPPAEPVVAAAAPPAPTPAPAPAVVRQEISLACPGYQTVLSSMLEDAIDRVGIAGTMRTRLTVRGGQVVDVTFLSGPKEYAKYVQAAVKRMHCSAGGADEVQVPLDVNFAH